MSASASKHQQAKRCPKAENHGTPRKTQWTYSICALACMTLCLSLHDLMQFWLFESGLDWTCFPALRNADRTDIWWKSREFACSMRFDDDRNGRIDYIELLGNGHMNIWNIHLKTPGTNIGDVHPDMVESCFIISYSVLVRCASFKIFSLVLKGQSGKNT